MRLEINKPQIVRNDNLSTVFIDIFGQRCEPIFKTPCVLSESISIGHQNKYGAVSNAV